MRCRSLMNLVSKDSKWTSLWNKYLLVEGTCRSWTFDTTGTSSRQLLIINASARPAHQTASAYKCCASSLTSSMHPGYLPSQLPIRGFQNHLIEASKAATWFAAWQGSSMADRARTVTSSRNSTSDPESLLWITALILRISIPAYADEGDLVVTRIWTDRALGFRIVKFCGAVVSEGSRTTTPGLETILGPRTSDVWVLTFLLLQYRDQDHPDAADCPIIIPTSLEREGRGAPFLGDLPMALLDMDLTGWP